MIERQRNINVVSINFYRNINTISKTILLIITFIFLFGCPKPHPSTIKEKNLGYQWYKSAMKDIDSCEKLVKEASTLFEQKDYKGASRKYKKALSIIPDYEPAFLGLASVYFKYGDLKSCEIEINKVLKINPQNSIAFNQLGYLFKIKGDQDLAVKYYLLAIKYDPNNIVALLDITYLYINLNEFDEAEKYLGKALKIDPGNKQSKECLEYLKNRKEKQKAR